MARPTNHELFEKLHENPELENGTEQAVAAAKASAPAGVVLEATKDEDGTCEVTVGFPPVNGKSARIIEVSVDAEGNVCGTEDRCDMAREGEDPEHHTKARKKMGKKKSKTA